MRERVLRANGTAVTVSYTDSGARIKIKTLHVLTAGTLFLVSGELKAAALRKRNIPQLNGRGGFATHLHPGAAYETAKRILELTTFRFGNCSS
jgi:hypothetical protein